MKRVLCLVCIVTLLLSACSVPEPETTEPEQTVNYTQGIYELTFKAKKVSNDSVGNEWTITYKHNGKTVKSGHRVLLSLEVFTFQTIEVEIREDDKLDDVGTGDMKVAICDGGSGKTTITVTENGGRYKGECAVWEITCTAKLVGKQQKRYGEPDTAYRLWTLPRANRVSPGHSVTLPTARSPFRVLLCK